MAKNNWEEILEKGFGNGDGGVVGNMFVLNSFIRTEIISKLIADIPDYIDVYINLEKITAQKLTKLKQELKDKWL